MREMLFDTVFREQVAEAQHVLTGSVDIVHSDATSVVTITQEQSMDRAPGFVQKIVGTTLPIVTTETWTSPTHADLVVEIPGKPVQMSGTIDLAESGGETVETINLSVKVSMPLIGGKAEEAVADIFTKAYAKDELVARKWLAEN